MTMKSTQNQIPNLKPLASFTKLFNTRLQVLNLLCYFLFLCCFLCLGVLLVSYGKTVSISLQVTQFAVSSVSIPKPSPPIEIARTDSENETRPSPPTGRAETNVTGNAGSIPNKAETGTIRTDSEKETGNAGSIPRPSPPTGRAETATKTDSDIPKPRLLPKYPEPPKEIRHGMGDEELLRMASRTPRSIEEYESVSGNNLKPKVAYMFLTKGPVLLAPLWEKFFHGHQGLFSIYVHSDLAFNEFEPESSVFHNRRIPSKEVQWGHVNMIEAERRLLANALLDYSNQRFVLLSESCIPLFNFETIYSYLMDTNQSFVEMLDLPGPVGRGRYTDQLRPLVTAEMWRKGSQWFQIDRYLAMEVVRDQTYFPAFQKYCRKSCYSDEHYLATFVSIKFPERSANRTLTWVDWSKGEAHPSSFRREHVTYGFLGWLRDGSPCMYNGKTTNVCHLFARKFTTHALDRLVRFSPKLMQFHR